VDETDPATLVTRTPTLLTLKMPRSEGRSFVRLISTLP